MTVCQLDRSIPTSTLPEGFGVAPSGGDSRGFGAAASGADWVGGAAGLEGGYEPPTEAKASFEGALGGESEPAGTAAPPPPLPSPIPDKRSRRSRRETSASGRSSASGIVERISASSSDRRGDVVQRMSVCAVSSNEITRAISGAEYF